MRKQLSEKLKEAVASVIPVTLIVLLLQIITPMPTNMLIAFLIGAVMLVLGMGLFSLGADIAMMPMGERIGAHIIKSKHYLVLIPAVFMIGALITVAEPDLQVLADQFETLNRWTVILTVAAGVGSFLVLALVRIIKKFSLRRFCFHFMCLFSPLPAQWQLITARLSLLLSIPAELRPGRSLCLSSWLSA